RSGSADQQKTGGRRALARPRAHVRSQTMEGPISIGGCRELCRNWAARGAARRKRAAGRDPSWRGGSIASRAGRPDGDPDLPALRARMVPSATPGPGRAHALRLSANAAGYVDPGWACRVDARGLIVTAPPPGFTVIGGYTFHLNWVEEFVAESDPNATIVALP